MIIIIWQEMILVKIEMGKMFVPSEITIGDMAAETTTEAIIITIGDTIIIGDIMAKNFCEKPSCLHS
uniref:Uncharacterized protein n=1 Tax=Acrobeloides nanus TaxID=290746 RepID=A0A914DTY5_9BILA